MTDVATLHRPVRWEIRAFERSEPIVAAASTISGRLIILGIAAILLRPFTPLWPAVLLATAALTLADRRYAAKLAAVATLAIFAVAPNWYGDGAVRIIAERAGMTGALSPVLRWGAPCLVLAFACAFLAAVRAGRPQWLARHPLTALFAILFGMVIWSSQGPDGAQAKLWSWSLTSALGGYIWFVALVATEQRASSNRVPFWQMFVALHPFWGSTGVPYTQAPKKLNRVAALDATQLAICQLKGLKLLIWAYVLMTASYAYAWIVHQQFGIPSYHNALTAYLGPGLPWGLRWSSLASDFFEAVLHLAAMGHSIIACARLAGYNLLRNTYKPFASRNIAEFWGRYYYYFKEMLLNLFYFPTFFSCFRGQPRLRAAFATFMAAGVGNALFHFVREIDQVAALGLWRALVGYQTYLFYCVGLSSGIVVSQLLAPRRTPNALSTVGRAAAFARVMGFFCLLQVFDDTSRSVSLGDHMRFLVSLFVPNW